MTDELTELHEHAEHGREHRDRAPITLTMAVLAVLVATVSLLGHRTHTEEIILQNKVTDQWAYYQAKNIRLHEMQSVADLIGVLDRGEKEKAEALREKYKTEIERYEKDKDQISEKAKELENERAVISRKEDRFDAGEVVLDIALIICSLTLLTRRKIFWYTSMVIGVVGIFIGISGFLIH